MNLEKKLQIEKIKMKEGKAKLNKTANQDQSSSGF